MILAGILAFTLMASAKPQEFEIWASGTLDETGDVIARFITEGA